MVIARHLKRLVTRPPRSPITPKQPLVNLSLIVK
jgi:hypothetical protein